MRDLCQIKKLNTTAYHPECDGMVERTLKSMLRKHALASNGIVSCRVYSTLTGIHPTKVLERSLPTYYLEPICVRPQKLLIFHRQNWTGQFLVWKSLQCYPQLVRWR